MEQLWRSGWFVFGVALFAFAGAVSLVWFFEQGPTMTLSEISVEVSEKNGVENWDPKGNLPDIAVRVRQGGGTVGRCDDVKDSLVATCKLDESIKVDKPIEVVVVDRDTVLDDPIGRASFDVPREGHQIWTGDRALRKVEISVTAHGSRVKRLWPGVLGILIGIGVVLLAWFVALREHLGAGAPSA